MVSKKEGRGKGGKEGGKEERKRGRKQGGRGGKGKKRNYEEGRIRCECKPVFLCIIPRSESPLINLLEMVFPGPYPINSMNMRVESPVFSLCLSFPICAEKGPFTKSPTSSNTLSPRQVSMVLKNG